MTARCGTGDIPLHEGFCRRRDHACVLDQERQDGLGHEDHGDEACCVCADLEEEGVAEGADAVEGHVDGLVGSQ